MFVVLTQVELVCIARHVMGSIWCKARQLFNRPFTSTYVMHTRYCQHLPLLLILINLSSAHLEALLVNPWEMKPEGRQALPAAVNLPYTII